VPSRRRRQPDEPADEIGDQYGTERHPEGRPATVQQQLQHITAEAVRAEQTLRVVRQTRRGPKLDEGTKDRNEERHHNKYH
jgi:hypothetical protein